MTLLIAILGVGKGTWLEVHGLLQQKLFDTTILFVDGWAAKDYRNEYNAILIPLPETATEQLAAFMKTELEKHKQHAEFDIAINIASGSGRQHAALLAAVLQLGYGVRIVSFENNELKTLV